MSAVRSEHAGPQFHQLPMFLTAREIRSKYQGLDGDREQVVDDWDAPTEVVRPETDDEMYDRKFDEALVTGDKNNYGDPRSLAEAIEEDGVRNPVSLQFPDLRGSLGKPQVLGGHHRVAVMDQTRPNDLMPVEHFPTTGLAKKSLGGKY